MICFSFYFPIPILITIRIIWISILMIFYIYCISVASCIICIIVRIQNICHIIAVIGGISSIIIRCGFLPNHHLILEYFAIVGCKNPTDFAGDPLQSLYPILPIVIVTG